MILDPKKYAVDPWKTELMEMLLGFRWLPLEKKFLVMHNNPAYEESPQVLPPGPINENFTIPAIEY